MAETDFEAGTLVRHRQWGIGEVIGGNIEERKLLVEFDQGSEMEFGLEVAHRALRVLPEGGLASLGRQDRDMLRHWARESVLRLITAAIIDLEQEAKSTKLPAGIKISDLRASIETSGAIDGAWAGWWKRARRVIEESPYFGLHRATISSRRAVGTSLPDVPLPPAEKKKPTRKPSKDEISRLVADLANGDASAELSKPLTPKALASLVRELASRQMLSKVAPAVFFNDLAPDVRRLESVLSTLFEVGATWEALALLGHLVRELIASADDRETASRRKVLNARLELLRKITKRVFAVPPPPGLAMSPFWAQSSEAWIDARDRSPGDQQGVGAVLEQLLGNYLDVFAESGVEQIVGAFRIGANATSARAALTALARRISEPTRVMLLARLLEASPAQVSDAAWDHLSRSVPEEAIKTLWRWMPTDESRGDTAEAIAKLVCRLDRKPETPVGTSMLALAVEARSFLSAAPELDAVIKRHAMSVLEVAAKGTELPEPHGMSSTAWSLIEAARDHAAQIRRSSDAARRRLEVKLSELEQAGVTARQERDQSDKLASELKGAFKSPERWTAFNAKVQVFEALTGVLQEAMVSAATGVPSWVSSFDLALARFGVERDSEMEGVLERFDPERHAFATEGGRIDAFVFILAPGYRMRDPDGGVTILKRALVEEVPTDGDEPRD